MEILGHSDYREEAQILCLFIQNGKIALGGQGRKPYVRVLRE